MIDEIAQELKQCIMMVNVALNVCCVKLEMSKHELYKYNPSTFK